MSLVDPHGRRINYLRLSVTGRCNLRCSYCRPHAGDAGAERGEVLSDEELLLLARTAVGIGIEKIRVTGGEPLLRRGIVGLLGRVGALAGLRKLVLTTNGLLLPEMACGVRGAGVESLNVSLDSLDPERFARITGGGRVRAVLDGIDRALEAGFPRLKINVVVMRGVNDDEVGRFASLTLDRPLAVRFIEPMDLGGNGCGRGLTVPGDEIVARIRRSRRLVPCGKEEMAGPARYYRMEGALGTIGIISPVSCGFCGECNRIRVTSDAVAKGCLFSPRDVDLKPFLGTGDAEGLRGALLRVVGGKPAGRILPGEGAPREPLRMSRIGG